MPLMTLNRDYTLTTTLGHMITFEKNEPTHVPDMCVPAAVSVGAVLADGSRIEVIPKDPQPIKEVDAAERARIIAAAIEKMVLRGDRGDFAASGAPQLKRLVAACGFSIADTERDEAWRAYQAAAPVAGE